jgi:hypothetical protein
MIFYTDKHGQKHHYSSVNEEEHAEHGVDDTESETFRRINLNQRSPEEMRVD